MRSMLSATVGAPDALTDTHVETLIDTFVIVPPPAVQLPGPIAVQADLNAARGPQGDGEPVGPPPDISRPQRAMSPIQPQAPVGWVQSTVTAVSQPMQTDFEVSTVTRDGDTNRFSMVLPPMSHEMVHGVEHALARYVAQQLVHQDNPRSEIELAFSNSVPDMGNHGPVGVDQGGNTGTAGDTHGVGTDPYLDKLPQSTAASTFDPLMEALESTTATSQHSYDSAFQEYATQLRLLPFDQGTSTGLSAVAITDAHVNLDGAEGGFVTLDGGNSLDGANRRSDGDPEDAVIDEAIASLGNFKWSSSNDTHGEQDSDTNSADVSMLAAANSALVDASGQGGMVLLESTASNSGDSTSLAAAQETPLESGAPANVKLEASVGVYQAFDVATVDPAGPGVTPATVTNGGTTTSATKHERQAKDHVSADKAAKPATDQASAWIEMFTAAAVVGATKKRRKSRTIS
jgi:hypothetical protein